MENDFDVVPIDLPQCVNLTRAVSANSEMQPWNSPGQGAGENHGAGRWFGACLFRAVMFSSECAQVGAYLLGYEPSSSKDGGFSLIIESCGLRCAHRSPRVAGCGREVRGPFFPARSPLNHLPPASAPPAPHSIGILRRDYCILRAEMTFARCVSPNASRKLPWAGSGSAPAACGVGQRTSTIGTRRLRARRASSAGNGKQREWRRDVRLSAFVPRRAVLHDCPRGTVPGLRADELRGFRDGDGGDVGGSNG